MGGDRPKQWLDLAGISILERSIRIFDVCAQVGEIVVALTPGSLALELRGTLQTPLHVVEGGATRQDSVARGFAATAEQAEFVVVHDAARPLCPVSLVERTLEAAAVHGAAIAALAALFSALAARAATTAAWPHLLGGRGRGDAGGPAGALHRHGSAVFPSS